MRNIRVKRIAVFGTTIFLIGLLFPLSIVQGINRFEDNVSYPVSYVPSANSIQSDGFDFKINRKFEKKDYIESIYSNKYVQHFEYRDSKNYTTEVNIILVDAKGYNAQNLLEEFILETHGVGLISQSNEFSIKGLKFFQLAYNLHNDINGRFYDIYTSTIKGDVGIIFELSYLAENNEINVFDDLKDSAQSYYDELIRSIQISKKMQDIKSNSYKLRGERKLNPEIVNIYKKINLNFKSTL